MRKWLFLLCLLLFADAWLLGELEERTSLDTLREAGIPEESFQKAGISKEESLLYIGFWKDLEESLKKLKTDYIDIYQFHNPAFCPKPGDESGLY